MLIARRVACARSVAPSRRLFVPHRPFFFGRSGEGDESSPKESGASASSVVVDTPDDSDNVTPLGVGDQAPKVPRVLKLSELKFDPLPAALTAHVLQQYLFAAGFTASDDEMSWLRARLDAMKMPTAN